MTNRSRLYFLTFVSISEALLGCRREPSSVPVPSEAPALSTTSETTWPLTVTDALGRKVKLEKPVNRIVSLTPSNTELLHAVGAGAKVVGGTTLDNYPPEARVHPKVGGMSPRSINLEAVVALRPDLVLTTSGIQESLVEPLERIGQTVIALDARDFQEVAHNLRTVGRITGHAAEAERVAVQFLKRTNQVEQQAKAHIKTKGRPQVLYLVHDDPLTTAGSETFIGRMIEAAGGRNVFDDVSARFPKPSEEEIVVRAPEIILASYGPMGAKRPDNETRRERLRARPGWSRIPAIQNNRILFLDEDIITRPGPRLAEGLEAIAEALASSAPRSAD